MVFCVILSLKKKKNKTPTMGKWPCYTQFGCEDFDLLLLGFIFFPVYLIANFEGLLSSKYISECIRVSV